MWVVCVWVVWMGLDWMGLEGWIPGGVTRPCIRALGGGAVGMGVAEETCVCGLRYWMGGSMDGVKYYTGQRF